VHQRGAANDGDNAAQQTAGERNRGGGPIFVSSVRRMPSTPMSDSSPSDIKAAFIRKRSG
jgi:hypothetical protein